jgi:hypothetical protein
MTDEPEARPVGGRIGPAYRTLLFCAGLAVATKLGWSFANCLNEEVLKKHPNLYVLPFDVTWLTSTISIGVVVALVKDVLLILSNFPTHAAAMRLSAWTGDILKMFAVVAGCSLLLLTYHPPAPPIPPAPAPLPVLPAYPVVVDKPGMPALAELPIFFKINAKRDGDPLPPASKGMPAMKDWKTGVTIDKKLTPEAYALMAELVELLKSRCTDGREGIHFRLRVVGYASSAEFKDDLLHSNDLNLDVSNERAGRALIALESLTKADPSFAVSFKPYKDFEDMVVQRLYLDRIGPQMALDREYLNRRVDIVIEEAGSCTTPQQVVDEMSRAN